VVRVGDCASNPAAVIPLATAASNDALTTLPAATIPAQTGAAQGGTKDLCLSFTRAKLDPMWVIDSVSLETAP